MYIVDDVISDPLDTGYKLNVHKTLCLMYVKFMFCVQGWEV